VFRPSVLLRRLAPTLAFSCGLVAIVILINFGCEDAPTAFAVSRRGVVA
jgi:hypothetical protein